MENSEKDLKLVLSDKLQDFTEIKWARPCNRVRKLNWSLVWVGFLFIGVVLFNFGTNHVDSTPGLGRISVAIYWMVASGIIGVAYLLIAIIVHATKVRQTEKYKATIYGADWQHLYIYRGLEEGDDQEEIWDLDKIVDLIVDPKSGGLTVYTKEESFPLYLPFPDGAKKELELLIEKNKEINDQTD